MGCGYVAADLDELSAHVAECTARGAWLWNYGDCSVCGAQAGEWCLTTGARRREPHGVRIQRVPR